MKREANITINPESKRGLNDYAKRCGLSLVVLFGSRALVELATEKSDYDVAVLFDRSHSFPQTLSENIDLQETIARALNIPLEKLDLTNFGTNNIFLRYEIARAGRLLYGDPMVYEEYKSFAKRDHQDARPLFNLERVLARRRLEFLRP